MIANISHTYLAKPLIDYNEEKVKVGKAERIYYNGYSKECGKNVIINHFALHVSESKRKDRNMHISLNFSSEDKDKISDELLIDIGKEYLRELGFPEEHPTVIYRHFDTVHPHIHIVTPKILERKRIIVDSNLKYRSQAITRMLEKKFELSEVLSVKSKVNVVPDALRLKLNDIKDEKIKIKKMSFAVDYILKNFNPVSFTEFQKQLELVGINAIIAEGVSTNTKPFTSIHYNGIDSTDKPIKSSRLYSSPTFKNLEKSFARNASVRAKRYKEIFNFINRLSNKYDKINFETFQKELLKINIEVTFITKGDQVSAYRFYDKEQHLNYKPSDIHRSLSFGQMKDKFSVQSIRNATDKNKTLLYVFDKKYKELYPEHEIEKNPQHYILFMARCGLQPDIKDGEVRFNHYTNRNPTDGDYVVSAIKNSAKINTAEIADVIYDRKYKFHVWQHQNLINSQQLENKQMPEGKSLEDLLKKGLQIIMEVFSPKDIPVKKRTNQIK